MIKYVQLKQQFDVSRMQGDLKKLEAALWQPHYNKKHYEGDWTALPLRSINGIVDNCISIHSGSLQPNMAFKDTSNLDICEYLPCVINFFECEKMSVRLMKLNAGAIIKEHTDHDMSFEEGEARFHIPVCTNERVDFFIETEKIPMKEGECWYLNLSLKHSVNNFGDTNRVHLVIDCKVNDWVSNLLNEQTVIKKEFTPAFNAPGYNADDKIKIIQQLRMMGTQVANDLANKMETAND